MRLGELALLLDAELIGPADGLVMGAAPLQTARPEHLAALFEPRYRAAAAQTRAGVVLTTPRLQDHLPEATPRLLSDVPRTAWGLALRALHPPPHFEPPPIGVDPRAAIHPTASIDPSARIGPFVSVGARAVIGADVTLFAGGFVGADVELGARTTLHPGATVLDRCVLGADVWIGGRAVIGSLGFGIDGAGRLPHVGRVIVGAAATIGAGSCVDRGTVGDTVIGPGAHLDNLVQVGHNAQVGAGARLCGQVGLAGGARVEPGVMIGGQAGVAGTATVGANARVAAQSGVTRDLAAGGSYSGHPAEPNRGRLRRIAALRRLLDR